MSDKLFVRDIIEQITKLDPTLPTNVVSIRTGSFQDMTRVHLLDDRQEEEQSLDSEIIARKRRLQELDADLKQLESKIRDSRITWGQEQLAHKTTMLQLREKLHHIRRSWWTRTRPLPLP
jgi:hypothetical protein